MTVLVCICVVLALVAACAVYMANSYRKQKNEAVEEKEQAQEIAKDVQKKLTDANNVKAEVRTGNHSNDLSNMAGKLHEYAHRKQ